MNVLIKTLLFVSPVLALTACNQPTSPNVAVEKTTASTTVSDPHAGHHMNHTANTVPNGASSQPAHIAEYTQAMTAMHEHMMSASKITNPDVAFAAGMIPHHQGAVEMAKIQLKYGKDSQMRQLAQNIINAQQTEISQMQTWLTAHQQDPTTSNTPAPSMSMHSHESMMKGIAEADPDIAFAKGMIPHHQGAIEMAEVELQHGKNPEMLKLAKQIKSAQDPEIKQMQDWLAKKGVK